MNSKLFPEATESEKKAGWKISKKFLHKVQELYGDKAEREGINKEHISYPSPDEIETILILANEALSKGNHND